MSEEIEKRKRWLKRLQAVQRNYAFQRWMDKPEGENLSVFKVLKWVWNDINFLVKWNINLLLQLKKYGAEVKKYSGLSFFEQWKRMAYLVFVIRADSSKFRYNHLFDQDRWDNVDFFLLFETQQAYAKY